jgi:hypothetical protein
MKLLPFGVLPNALLGDRLTSRSNQHKQLEKPYSWKCDG